MDKDNRNKIYDYYFSMRTLSDIFTTQIVSIYEKIKNKNLIGDTVFEINKNDENPFFTEMYYELYKLIEEKYDKINAPYIPYDHIENLEIKSHILKKGREYNKQNILCTNKYVLKGKKLKIPFALTLSENTILPSNIDYYLSYILLSREVDSNKKIAMLQQKAITEYAWKEVLVDIKKIEESLSSSGITSINNPTITFYDKSELICQRVQNGEERILGNYYFTMVYNLQNNIIEAYQGFNSPYLNSVNLKEYYMNELKYDLTEKINQICNKYTYNRKIIYFSPTEHKVQ